MLLFIVTVPNHQGKSHAVALPASRGRAKQGHYLIFLHNDMDLHKYVSFPCITRPSLDDSGVKPRSQSGICLATRRPPAASSWSSRYRSSCCGVALLRTLLGIATTKPFWWCFVAEAMSWTATWTIKQRERQSRLGPPLPMARPGKEQYTHADQNPLGGLK
jgi:hypothetical protein